MEPHSHALTQDKQQGQCVALEPWRPRLHLCVVQCLQDRLPREDGQAVVANRKPDLLRRLAQVRLPYLQLWAMVGQVLSV